MQIRFQRLHPEELCVAIWLENLLKKGHMKTIKKMNSQCLMWRRHLKERHLWISLTCRRCLLDLVLCLVVYMGSKLFLVFMLSDQGGSGHGHGIHYNCSPKMMEELMAIGLYWMEELRVIGLYMREELMVIGLYMMERQRIGRRCGDRWSRRSKMVSKSRRLSYCS